MHTQLTYHPVRLVHFIYATALFLLLFLFVTRPIIDQVLANHKSKSELFEAGQEEDPVQEESEDRVDSFEALKFVYLFECQVLNALHKKSGIHYAFSAFKETYKTVRLPPPQTSTVSIS